MMHNAIRQSRGVTLIEMIIVVTIISILAAIAYPSYLERTQRVKRTDAKTALLNIAGQQERFFFKNNRFATTLAELNVATATENEYYTLSLDSPSSSTFTATASPSTTGGQADDPICENFTIDQLGRKRATGGGDGSGEDPSALCWR